MNAPPPGKPLPAGWWRRVRHDLRSAIAPMRMAVQLLRAGRIDAAEREEALQVIDRQVEQLLAAVEDLSDLLQVQSGGFALQPSRQDANLLLDVVCGRGALQRELASRSLSLRCETCDAEAMVAHEPARLANLIEFLLLRMSAHAAAGGELVLALRQRDGVSLHLSGADGTLAEDAELRFLQGLGAGDEEPGLRALLLREVMRAGGMKLQAEGEGGLALRFATPP